MPVSLPPHQWDLLLRCPLFQACPEALVRDVLARSGCSVEDFSSGAEIYRPDRFRRCLGLLLSGRVLVTKGSLTVSTLEPGDLFGAAALYNDAPDYATTLTAQGICRCLLLDQELLDRLLGEEALLRRNYLTYLTGRIRFLNARLGSLAVGDTEGRWSAICSAASPMAQWSAPPRSGPPAGHQPRLGVSGLSGLGTGRPDPAGGTGHPRPRSGRSGGCPGLRVRKFPLRCTNPVNDPSLPRIGVSVQI